MIRPLITIHPIRIANSGVRLGRATVFGEAKVDGADIPHLGTSSGIRKTERERDSCALVGYEKKDDSMREPPEAMNAPVTVRICFVCQIFLCVVGAFAQNLLPAT
ncbi:hypothetical protein PO909_017131 [Leuciscus waleckii]